MSNPCGRGLTNAFNAESEIVANLIDNLRRIALPEISVPEWNDLVAMIAARQALSTAYAVLNEFRFGQ